MNRLHVVMPFYRPENRDKIIDLYEPYDIILHPITTEPEFIEWGKEWVVPVLCSDYPEGMNPVNHKLNYFIKSMPIWVDDHYWWMNDDDSFEDNVIPTLKAQHDDVIFISMKRGKKTPMDAPPICRHPTFTLFARPESVHVAGIGAEQMIIKGSIFKTLHYDDVSFCADGYMAIYLKDKYPVKYIENIFVKFNYFEAGRWD